MEPLQSVLRRNFAKSQTQRQREVGLPKSFQPTQDIDASRLDELKATGVSATRLHDDNTHIMDRRVSSGLTSFGAVVGRGALAPGNGQRLIATEDCVKPLSRSAFAERPAPDLQHRRGKSPVFDPQRRLMARL